MKLIFSNTEQIRKVTGFTDADLEFEKLQTSLEIATDELSKIIGKQTYTALQELFKTDPDPETESDEFELVNKTQICIAFRGIAHYAPLNDLAFTNQGRLLRSDEHHKSAFEWMIDRSNDSLEKIYYKSLDRLIEALDEINPEVIAVNGANPAVKWKDTDAYKNSFDTFFRTTDEFDQYFTIESRYLLMKLAPGIRKIQQEEIIPRIGQTVFDDYLAKIKASQPVENAKVLAAMKCACAYLSLSWAIKRMSALLFPTGVLQAYVADRMTTQAKKTPEGDQVGVVALCFQKDGEKALLELEELMKPALDPNAPAEGITDVKFNCNQKFIST